MCPRVHCWPRSNVLAKGVAQTLYPIAISFFSRAAWLQPSLGGPGTGERPRGESMPGMQSPHTAAWKAGSTGKGGLCCSSPFSSEVLKPSHMAELSRKYLPGPHPRDSHAMRDSALVFESFSGDSNVHPELLETTASVQGVPGLWVGLPTYVLCAFPILPGLCQSLISYSIQTLCVCSGPL